MFVTLCVKSYVMFDGKLHIAKFMVKQSVVSLIRLVYEF